MKAREILIITETGDIRYDSGKVPEILASVCYRATHDNDFLSVVLKAAAGLIGAMEDSETQQAVFNGYVESVRRAMVENGIKISRGEKLGKVKESQSAVP